MKLGILAFAAAGTLLLATAAPARADEWHGRDGWRHDRDGRDWGRERWQERRPWGYGRPWAYVPPPPVDYAPPPYYPPQYYPPPRVYAPPPGVYFGFGVP